VTLTDLFGAPHVASGPHDMALRIPARKSRPQPRGNSLGRADRLFQQNRPAAEAAAPCGDFR